MSGLTLVLISFALLAVVTFVLVLIGSGWPPSGGADGGEVPGFDNTPIIMSMYAACD